MTDYPAFALTIYIINQFIQYGLSEKTAKSFILRLRNMYIQHIPPGHFRGLSLPLKFRPGPSYAGLALKSDQRLGHHTVVLKGLKRYGASENDSGCDSHPRESDQ